MNGFFQEPPQISSNQFLDDKILISFLKKNLPKEIYNEIEPDLINFGEKVINEILEMANDAEENLPEHIPFDAFGKRIDKIKIARGWEQLSDVSAKEGLISIAYERKYGPFSRLYQMSKLYLFSPSSAVFSCPLAMTDGAAKLIERFGDDELKNSAFKNLTSNEVNKFWTSGQWMTEKIGGSDVANSETIARKIDGKWKLFGYKWFTSSITSPMCMTLARIENSEGKTFPGNSGLSLFYLELKDKNGNYNNLNIIRLKNKLGTKALPTAEVELNGVEAKLVGTEGKGVKTIATLFNITRIHNALNAISFSRRIIALLKDYSNKRMAFGKKLIDHPLHKLTLDKMEKDFKDIFYFTFYAITLLGFEEAGTPEQKEWATPLLRIYTPLVKLYTAKINLEITSEAIEGFGGIGYLEDSNLGKWLRDAQTLSIWEGTTNVLALDVLRSMEKENTFRPFIKNLEKILDNVNDSTLSEQKNIIRNDIKALINFVESFSSRTRDEIEASARDLAFKLSKVAIKTHLLNS